MDKNTKIIIGIVAVFALGCVCTGIVGGVAALMVKNTSDRMPNNRNVWNNIKPPDVSNRSDDFSDFGPYVKPTIKDGRFYGTRAYAKGIGKYPVEFSVKIPSGSGWKTQESKRRTDKNFVQFIKFNKAGGEVDMFSVGYMKHTRPYNSDNEANRKLAKELGEKLARIFEQQFEAKGAKTSIDHRGWNKRQGRYEYRVDLHLSKWVNVKSPKGPYMLTMLFRPRLDHKPHGVTLLIASEKTAEIPNHDAMLTKGILGETLASFRFEH